MNFDNDCFYCVKDARLTNLMIEVCKLEASTLYLFKEQTYKGRCVVAYNGHKSEIFNLTDEERSKFMGDVSRVAGALNKAFSPDKINYGAYADTMTHLHFHIVPKYKGGPSFGGTFEMSPKDKVLLKDEEYNLLINKIKENL
ncbi:HIT family protein [Clostridium estertheticum]|uniref:HIT family protein n=1 Tax=Clostridium estertheticum TaxID=238834 RepID=A0AA47I9U9_9CLOT|nr:HIT family protein [Clostridium estertheticum]MBU3154145.1 HIT family protein [Clostridium estertheticum]MBU3199695.1 HIT family protein [Clostridium estertheticum]WAG62844.1 HIT family protein [Clostridium estertheticum]WAG67647.1 HIT family protein [Clostridium estertheticum]